MEVRPFKLEDANACVELGKQMWAESPVFSSHELEVGKFTELADLCLNDDNFGGFVAVKGEEIVGFWAGSVQQFWYSKDYTIRDFVFYVSPEHRGSSAAMRLLKAVEIWAGVKGVKELNLGVSSLVDADKTACFFKKMGYDHQISVFNKRL